MKPINDILKEIEGRCEAATSGHWESDNMLYVFSDSDAMIADTGNDCGSVGIGGTMLAALFVETNGAYFNDKRIDPWDIGRDAMKYKGPHKVIAHPPCKRWGRYWGGGPMLHGTDRQLHKGDDDGMFAKALWAVRTFGGVIEHPEASHAWKWYGLNTPPYSGGWVRADEFGALTCCVAQGHYGHCGQKMTWLYMVNGNPLELKWGRCKGKQLMEDGFHSKEERTRLIKTGICHRMSAKQRAATPVEFKELLIELMNGQGVEGE